jgi:hypothetical protein
MEAYSVLFLGGDADVEPKPEPPNKDVLSEPVVFPNPNPVEKGDVGLEPKPEKPEAEDGIAGSAADEVVAENKLVPLNVLGSEKTFKEEKGLRPVAPVVFVDAEVDESPGFGANILCCLLGVFLFFCFSAPL